MSKYTITKIERKTTSTGKEKADVTLLDENGIEQSGVTIWADFVGFTELKEGSDVLGEVVVKQSGKYTNRTLYAPKKNLSQFGKSPFAIKEAQATKREDIAHAQDRKEESIKEAAIFRDATILTNAYIGGRADVSSVDEIQKTWVMFRKWLKDQQDMPF